MKKMNFYAALAATVLFAACNKTLLTENVENSVSESKGAEVLLTVNDAEWTSDDSKTAYAPGTGVGLIGDEMLSIYYQDGTFSSEKPVFANANIKATPTGTPGQYSFTIPEEASGITHWFGLMPYSAQVNGFNSQRTSVNLRLGPVQFPGANTFDPHSDYLVARPFDISGVPGAASGEISSFKRLFAPLCVLVSGLESGDKIYTATLSLSQTRTSSASLAGVCFVSMDDTYSGTHGDMGVDAAGNAISAAYASGLAAVDGSWPIWLMVNPMTIASGGTMTLSLSTADKTYTRTVTLPSDQTLTTEQLNRFKFNIKGDGYVVRESVTQDFTSQTLTGTQTLTASDGSSLSWVSSITRTFSSASDGNSGIAGAMYAHNTFTFPTIAGKDIVGARIFCHPASRYGGGASASTLTVDGTDVYNFNLANYDGDNGMCSKGGALDISLPVGKTSLAGVTVTPTSQQNLISAITLFLEDIPVDPNDYYAQYEAGQDVTINGTVFNKSTNGEARLLKLYEMANATPLAADYTTNGILFLDYDAADEETDVISVAGQLQAANVVIIGRYRNHQPHIDMTSRNIGATGTQLYFKNVKISTSGYLFVTERTTTLNVSVEDCTLETSGDFVFCENNSSHSFGEIIVNNSVITVGKYLYAYRSAGGWADGDENAALTKIWLTNSVVYKESNSTYPLIAPRSGSSFGIKTPNLDVKIEYNSFYNLCNLNNGIVAIDNMAKLNFNYCVGEAELDANKDAVLVYIPAALETPITESTVSNNYFNNSGSSTKVWTYGRSALISSGVSASSNSFVKGTSPFNSVDDENGYFPVNKTVVTNGAGASYDTKYWRTW
ncbi:MAG: hypothetical protein J6X69_03930 [Bacteroidales bacterium]|nr:hypothetical protein [Bacteroidales bacterium]